MHGLLSRVALAVTLACFAVVADAQIDPLPTRESPAREWLSISDQPAADRAVLHDRSPVSLKGSLESARISVPGASYVKLHFSRLDLPDGLWVQVSDVSGEESYRYGPKAFDAHTVDRARGDDGRHRFYAMSITGDTAVVRLQGALHRFDPARHGVRVDAWLAGPNPQADRLPAKTSAADDGSHTETTCGGNERYDARCYVDSHPAAYDRSIPVALLITTSGEQCTAWRVGSDNRMFTAEHCVSGQGDLDGAEIWFQYRTSSCGGSSTLDPIKVTGGELLAKDSTLDYALFTVDDFASIAYIGHLGLDVRNGGLGEGIFIPQHGLGRPKQIAIESDMNTSGWCEIDDPDYYGYGTDTDIGYFCDTTTSSSGSPVVSRVTGDVIALHHLGGCFNSASKMSLIWPQVASYFGGAIPHGDGAVPWSGDEQPEDGNLPPDAQFSLSCDGLSCNFDGSSSDDSDGAIASYAWNFGDGASATGVTTAHTFDAAGTYTVKLSVEDDQGAVDSYQKSVSVEQPNRAPKARISAHCIDNNCEFDGTGSSDSDGEVVAWSWTFGDGAGASGGVAGHQYASAGTYTIRLTVEDDRGATDVRSYTTAISMPNQAPVAGFSVQCSELECEVDASASSDADGAIAAYSWTFGDGATATGMTAAHAYAADGSYTITLIAEDDDGAAGESSRPVTVQSTGAGSEPEPEPEPEPQNQAPTAAFSFSCDALSCEFDARSSADPDGEIAAWYWIWDDGRQGTGEQAAHEFPASGRYRVSLRVVDDQGADDRSSRYVTVEAGAQAPVADFSVDCSELSCTLDAGSSTDSDGTITRFDWAFGDGATGEGRTVTHKYVEDGVYEVTLKVSNGGTLSDTRTRTIEVVSERPIVLQAQGGSVNGRNKVLLTWSEAATQTVQIYRDGKAIATAPNTGKFLDTDAASLQKAARYRVCDSSGDHCSGEIVVILGLSWTARQAESGTQPGKFKR